MKKSNLSQAGQGPAGQDPPRAWRNRRFTNVEHVRKYMGDLINRIERGEVDDARGARLGNLANILCGMIVNSDLEKRLTALERAREDEE
jgi:hypothetical protein